MFVLNLLKCQILELAMNANKPNKQQAQRRDGPWLMFIRFNVWTVCLSKEVMDCQQLRENVTILIKIGCVLIVSFWD